MARYGSGSKGGNPPDSELTLLSLDEFEVEQLPPPEPVHKRFQIRSIQPALPREEMEDQFETDSVVEDKAPTFDDSIIEGPVPDEPGLEKDALRRKFREEGLRNFEAEQVLELLLSFGGGENIKQTAEMLLGRFGKITQVFQADLAELETLPGMTQESAMLMQMIPQIARWYLEQMQKTDDRLDTSEKVGQYLIPKFLGQTRELAAVLCLDNQSRPLRFEVISTGGMSESAVDIRRLVETAYQCKASAVILAHNHPFGEAYPSEPDIRFTQYLQQMLRPLGVSLLDHFILSGMDYVSMMEQGRLSFERERHQTLF